MKVSLNRAMQLEILTRLSMIYPGEADVTPEIDRCGIANIAYLVEHGLIFMEINYHIGGGVSWGDARISAKGLDFLADDGGLSAILGVVTVKLHADTVRSFIEAKIDQSTATAEEKGTFKRQLAALPQSALQAATSDLVQQGLSQIPDVFHWIRTLGGF